MRKMLPVFAVAALVLTGCGKGSASDSAAGTYKADYEGTKKILMAKMQRETPNRPYEDMTAALPVANECPEGLTLTLAADGTYTATQNGQTQGSGTWKSAGDTLKMARAATPDKVGDAKLVDGMLEVMDGGRVQAYLIKQ